MFIRFKSVFGTYHAIRISEIRRIEIGNTTNNYNMHVFFVDEKELSLKVNSKQLKIIDKQLSKYNGKQ
jgi:hypothetical protein